MKVLRIKSMFLASLIVAITLFTSLYGFAVERTPTEFYLNYGFEYEIEDPDKIPEQLFKLIHTLQSKTLKSPEDYLLIGDTYHWLGHIADDAQAFDKALEYYKAALEAYAQTPISHSRRIKNLNAKEHAEEHIDKTLQLSQMPLNERKTILLAYAEAIHPRVVRNVINTWADATIEEQRANLVALCESILTQKH